ncbi:hypothetical protein FB45DRAFT_756839 [Roridomyces roridus]|uniref:DUF6593 domain-containing protein n=1 Tax=Roridomyces roridus TaxID=1738132 RepID=A0AAD7FGD9_9AGAR|nr:hypothetical protein FB45DRAFT_756839 [Roridomyces roridus]
MPAQNTHFNPYASWQGSSRGPSTAPDMPSTYGALPYGSDPTTSNIVVFHFTSSNNSVLDSTVVGKNTMLYFRVNTDSSSMAGYSTVKNHEGTTISLIEWKDKPMVEIANMLSKRLVSDWLCLSRDASHRTMKVMDKKYVWAPRHGAICLYPAGTSTPELLAQIRRGEDGTVTLELLKSAVDAGLLDICVVATVMLQCGRNID